MYAVQLVGICSEYIFFFMNIRYLIPKVKQIMRRSETETEVLMIGSKKFTTHDSVSNVLDSLVPILSSISMPKSTFYK